MHSRTRLLAIVSSLLLTVGIGATQCPQPVTQGRVTLPGLSARVRVSTDARGVPHVEAETLADALRAQGYLHARDRFFQMDVTRRRAAGTLAELTGEIGENGFGSDFFLRDLGLRRAAERSAALLTDEERALFGAYVEGVNAWLAANPLPEPYPSLEITAVPPWDLLDSLSIGKLLAISLAHGRKTDLLDYSRTHANFVAKGQAASPPFDGAKLLDEDIARLEPMDHASTLLDAGVPPPFVVGTSQAGARSTPQPLAALPGLAQQLLARQAAMAASGLGNRELGGGGAGSNMWVVAGEHTATGTPLLAGDGHQPLVAPATLYEMQVAVRRRSGEEELNLGGFGPPGIPGITGGRSQRVAWSTTNPTSDVEDTFLDRLVRGDPECRNDEGQTVPLCIRSEGALHRVERRQEVIRYNLINGLPNDSIPLMTLDVLTVPFRGHGLVLEVEDRTILQDGPPAETTAYTLQWTGFLGGREGGALLGQMRARDVSELLAAARLQTGLPQNFMVADVEGNIGYRVAGEIPLRADLEAGAPLAAWFDVLDGSGPANWVSDEAHSQGQVLPYAVIPDEEMPHAVSPPAGFLINANNDPVGATFDNDPFNQFRPSNPTAIYYLGWSSGDGGVRPGRITRLLRAAIDGGQKLTVDDMKRMQANTQLLDAELMLPFLIDAWSHAQADDAPAELRDLVADDDRLAPAIARLVAWDFSTPTGIPEGWDASDEDGVRNPVVSPEEAAASVAATLYAAWRDAFREATVGAALQVRGLSLSSVGANWTWWGGCHHLLSQEPFTGVGASGVDFFPEPAGLAPTERRDFVLIQSVVTALDALAGPAYADAFGRSTNLDDYRWGRLHRLTMPSVRGANASIPPAGGFASLAPNLPGLARDGGLQSVNPGDFGGGSSASTFTFSFGSWSRLILAPGHPDARPDSVLAFSSLPGGPSGDPSSPLYVSQLGKWLTVDYDRMLVNARDVRAAATRVELFEPPAP